jgi:hypothetical protein
MSIPYTTAPVLSPHFFPPDYACLGQLAPVSELGHRSYMRPFGDIGHVSTYNTVLTNER